MSCVLIASSHNHHIAREHLEFISSQEMYNQRDKPCVITGTGPAWNSKNLRELSESITASIVFAHVRAATEGTDVTDLR